MVGKLVRDRIPEIIRAEGYEPNVRTLEGRPLLDALMAKVREEARELFAACDESGPNRLTLVTEELVDVLEVLNALAVYEGIAIDDLMRVREWKNDQRGGFKEGYWLEKEGA